MELSNGATVYLKPTDFKNDEILIEAISPGGTSMTGDNNYMSASNDASIITRKQEFLNLTLLSSKRSFPAKIVRLISLYYRRIRRTFRRMLAREDLRNEMQLLHLYFAEPEKIKSLCRLH
jgi:zinc protease